MPVFPVSSLDPFADDFLAAPYLFYAELREAGPVVWLERYGLWACARHAEVQAALGDWQTFSSAGPLSRARPNWVMLARCLSRCGASTSFSSTMQIALRRARIFRAFAREVKITSE